MDVEKLLRQGLQHHQAGRLDKAGEAYQQVLKSDPDNADALNLMGVILQAAGNLDAAITLITRATDLVPDFVPPFVNLGNALQEACRFDDAVDVFRKAIELAPDQAEAVNNLSSALNKLEHFDEALEASERAIELTPGLCPAHMNLGNALAGLGRTVEAVESYKRALEIDPTDSAAYYNLGNVYTEMENLKEALEQFRKALEFDTENAEKYYNYANTALALDLYEDATAGYRRALEIAPGYIDAQCNLGTVLLKMGRSDEAVASLRRAIVDEPKSPDLHWNLALALLQAGDYKDGWAEYEWRWQMPTFEAFQRDFGVPLWQGEDLDGRTLFIDTEQGFGDSIMFARYAPIAAERGGRVVLECRPQLNNLFASLNGVNEVVDLGHPPGHFDFYAPLMSLPHILGTTAETIPTDVPYVKPPEETPVDSRIAEAPGFKVGFAWAGSPTRIDNVKRSCDIALFEPLIALPGLNFFSLQVGEFQEQLRDLDTARLVIDLADDFRDFADTAAAVQALDLVISVDTAVLHLAGALAKPAWGLMSQPTGFLWQDQRKDSPWYPTLRLFRQPEHGEWAPVFEQVKRELNEMMAKS